jgi:hypothetical protein
MQYPKYIDTTLDVLTAIAEISAVVLIVMLALFHS